MGVLALGDEKMKIQLTGSALVGTASAVGLLDGEASAERTSNGIVAASDSADVSSGCTKAVELVRHLDVDDKILFLGLREAKGTRDIVGNLEWSESGDGIAGLVHVTLEWSGTISVHLVDGDSDGGTTRDLGHATSCELSLSLLSNVNVAINLSPSASIDNVLSNFRVTDDGSILLARGNSGAVAGNLRVNWTNVRR